MRSRPVVAVMTMWPLIVILASCSGSITLPAAQTPVVESILDIDHRVNAVYHHTGVFEMLPGARVELRLRAPGLTTVTIKVDGLDIPVVQDSAQHPEHVTSGYYRISTSDSVSGQDPLFFWRVFLVLPERLRVGGDDYTIGVGDTSKDASATGSQKEAVPLSIPVVHGAPSSPRPSSVFFQGPDAKNVKTGGDSAFIRNNVTLAGWLVASPGRGLSDPATEDWHYDIFLDNDFIRRNYPAVNHDLDGAIMPGRWFSALDATFHPNLRIPLTSSIPDAGTFLIPGTDLFTVELNAWHPSRHGGQVPTGWNQDSDPGAWPDVRWPFPVLRPAGITASDQGLQEGDYVIITGALVEDSAHLHWAAGEVPTAEDLRHECWFHNFQGHGGWLELHPLDSIRRVPPGQAPVQRKQPVVVQVCREDPGRGTALLVNRTLRPVPEQPPTDRSVLRYAELIDDRFTDMKTVAQHVVQVNPATQTYLQVHVQLNTIGRAYFKATYLLWWEEGSTPRQGSSTDTSLAAGSSPGPGPTEQTPTPTAASTPTTAASPTAAPSTSEPDTTAPEIPPMCSKKPYLPSCSLKNDGEEVQGREVQPSG